MKNPCRVILAIDLICCGFIFVPTHASGQFILSPVSVTETNLGTFSPDFAPLSAMIDQSGLDFPFTNGVTDFDNYFALPNNHYSKNADHTKWQSDFSFNLPFTGTIDFDLGASYAISKAAIWNVSVKSFSVQVAADAKGPWQDAGQFTLFDEQGSLRLEPTVLNLSGTYAGRYVRLAIASEYPVSPTAGFGYVTLGEFVVRTAPVGPRPFTISRDSFGNVVVTFSGTLQFAPEVNGPFADVEGNPQGTHTVTNASLTTRGFFRTHN